MVVLVSLGIGLSRWQGSLRSVGRIDPLNNALSPVFVGPSTGLSNGLQNISDFQLSLQQGAALRRENERLKMELNALSLYEERIQDFEARLNSIRKLNGFPSISQRQRVVAEVMSFDPGAHRMQISAGSAQGIAPGQAVICGDGLVGRIESTTGNRSYVQVVTSPAFRIGATILSNPQVSGLIRGSSRETMTMGNAEKSEHVAMGSQVVTSTFSERIPPYLPIGRVQKRVNTPELGLVEFTVKINFQVSRVREVAVVQ